MSDVKKLFELAHQILPPTTSQEPDPSLTLKNCVTRYVAESWNEALVNQINNAEVHEAFCACCLDFMYKCLNLCKETPSKDRATLFSVYQEKQLMKIMEFIVCLGIYPLIDVGVSLPLELRLDSQQIFNCPRTPDDETRNFKLMKIAKCFLEIIHSDSPQLQRLLSPSSFLGDLLAISAQLAYGPILVSKQHPEYEKCVSICREAQKQFWRLLCDLPGHIAMKELLILQGGARAGSKKVKGTVSLPPAPVWLRKSCGRLLSRLLVRGSSATDGTKHSSSGGVKQLLLAAISLTPAVVSCGTGPISSVDPRCQPSLASALARILSTPPSFVNKGSIQSQLESQNSLVRNYYANISEQVLQLLSFGVQTIQSEEPDSGYNSVAVARFGYLVGLSTVHEMCKITPQIASDLILWPLIDPLRKLVAENPIVKGARGFEDESVCTIPDASDEILLATSEELTRMIKYYTDLLECPNRSSAVLNTLVAHSRPIFYLLSQVIQDESAQNADQLQSEKLYQLKRRLLSILSQILNVATETSSSRLSVVRSWLGLDCSTTLNRRPISSVNLDHDDPNSTLTSLPCLPRLAYRSTTKIQLISPRVDPNPINTDLTVPYTCVLTTELVRITTEPQTWTCLISSLIELLQFMCPTKHDPESDELAPHLRQLISDESGSDTNQSVERNSLPADLFMSLIQDLNLRLSMDSNEPGSDLLPSIIQSDSNVNESTYQDTEKGIISSLLASAMLEQLGDSVWPQQVDRAVDLFELTFNRFNMISQNLSNCLFEEFVQETLSQLLGILAFYVNQLKPTSSSHSSTDRDQFGRLIPVLERLQTNLASHHPSKFSAQLELIQSLKASLLTRCAIPVNLSSLDSKIDLKPSVYEENDSKLSVSRASPKTVQPLIEELPSSNQPAQPESENQFTEPSDPLLRQTLNELKDPLLPVRGHALIVLSRLLESRDSRIVGYEEQIFKAIVDHLTDSDSYIYLNAIRALSAMGQAYTDRVLHILLQKFHISSSESNRSPKSEPCTDSSSLVEYRLKLGESIMRIIRDLGQMAPKYRSLLMQTFTVGSKDAEPLVRAASLSNLAEYVRLLQHSIGPVVYEIFSIIELHLTEDTSPLVRRAAAFLARSLFTSDKCDSKLPEWIPADMLRDLHRLLSTRRSIEKDTSVAEQVESALAELDKCTRQSVFLKTDTPADLIKEIRILHP